MPELLQVRRSSRCWEVRPVDLCLDWIPLPFTPEASFEQVRQHLARIFPAAEVVEMTKAEAREVIRKLTGEAVEPC